MAAQGFEDIPGERYEVVSQLGTGAFGSVYKAQDTFLNRAVAVKSIRLDTSLDPEQRKALNKRFILEAQVAAQLQHTNIVTIHDIMFTPDTGFIVMEFIEGSTLQSLMEKNQLRSPAPSTSPPRSHARSSTRTRTKSSIATSSRRTS